jgi:hypothetical protein
MLRVSVWIAVASLLALGCSEDPLKPSSVDHSIPSRTVGQLLSSPGTLWIGTTPVTVGVSLGRSQPGGLGGAAILEATPSAPLESISDVYLWVIRDRSEVWASSMSYYARTPTGGSAYETEAGPQWDIGAHVDAVVAIRTGGDLVRYALVRDIPIISGG